MYRVREWRGLGAPMVDSFIPKECAKAIAGKGVTTANRCMTTAVARWGRADTCLLLPLLCSNTWVELSSEEGAGTHGLLCPTRGHQEEWRERKVIEETRNKEERAASPNAQWCGSTWLNRGDFDLAPHIPIFSLWSPCCIFEWFLSTYLPVSNFLFNWA